MYQSKCIIGYIFYYFSFQRQSHIELFVKRNQFNINLTLIYGIEVTGNKSPIQSSTNDNNAFNVRIFQ